MKVKVCGKIVAVEPKEGKTGKYNAIVLIVEGEVLNTYTKNMEIKENAELQEVVMDMKKYKGVYSSFQVLTVNKIG